MPTYGSREMSRKRRLRRSLILPDFDPSVPVQLPVAVSRTDEPRDGNPGGKALQATTRRRALKSPATRGIAAAMRTPYQQRSLPEDDPGAVAEGRVALAALGALGGDGGGIAGAVGVGQIGGEDVGAGGGILEAVEYFGQHLIKHIGRSLPNVDRTVVRAAIVALEVDSAREARNA